MPGFLLKSNLKLQNTHTLAANHIFMDKISWIIHLIAANYAAKNKKSVQPLFKMDTTHNLG
jgi:hypothetical protein